MQNFILLGVISVLWAIYGYSLAFGPDIGHFIGNLDWLGLAGVGFEPFKAYSETIPHQTFMIYQAMFAVITPALITGAFAERAKFSTFLIFMLAWSFFVYDPVAHWVFANDGWASLAGSHVKALDFAGGTAIHVNAGAAALAAAIVFGPRLGFKTEPMEPHDVTMVVLGAALLWFGWFGFNAGSAGGATPQAVNAFVVTNSAAAAAALGWMFASWAMTGKASATRIWLRANRPRRSRCQAIWSGCCQASSLPRSALAGASEALARDSGKGSTKSFDRLNTLKDLTPRCSPSDEPRNSHGCSRVTA